MVVVGDEGSDVDRRSTDAWVNEAPETGVLCVVSPSSSMVVGLKGRGGSGRRKDSFGLRTHFLSGRHC